MCFRQDTSFFWFLPDGISPFMGNGHWISKLKKGC